MNVVKGIGSRPIQNDDLRKRFVAKEFTKVSSRPIQNDDLRKLSALSSAAVSCSRPIQNDDLRKRSTDLVCPLIGSRPIQNDDLRKPSFSHHLTIMYLTEINQVLVNVIIPAFLEFRCTRRI